MGKRLVIGSAEFSLENVFDYTVFKWPEHLYPLSNASILSPYNYWMAYMKPCKVNKIKWLASGESFTLSFADVDYGGEFNFKNRQPDDSQKFKSYYYQPATLDMIGSVDISDEAGTDAGDGTREISLGETWNFAHSVFLKPNKNVQKLCLYKYKMLAAYSAGNIYYKSDSFGINVQLIYQI